MAARTSVDAVAPAPTDHRLIARLVLATFMLLDAADFPYRLVIGEGPEEPWAPGLHRLAGLVACLSLLWGWHRVLVVSTMVTAGFVVVRQEITGFELWWLPIAVALASARRSAPLLVAVAAICGVFSVWTYETQGHTAVVGILTLCALGVLAGLAVGFVTTQRSAADARVEALRAENARLRRDERRLLAADLRTATEGLFSHARRESARSLASTEPADLHRALHAVRDDASAALASLRRLLEVLRATEVEAGTERASLERQAATRLRSVRLAAAVSLAGLAAAGALRAAPGLAPHEWTLVVALLVAALTCVRPAWGAPAGLLVLASTLFVDATAWVVAVSVTAVVAAVALAPWRTPWRLGALGGVLAYTLQRLLLGGADTLHDLAAVAAGALGATLMALAVRDYLHTMRRWTSDEERLASERADIGPGERTSLARDLHDQLGHQLSLVALQVNAVDHVRDPDRLREVLGRIDATLAAASGELEVLLSVMSAAPASAGASGPLVTPSVVSRVMGDKLAEHGHDAEIVVDPAVDEVDPTTRLTVVRVLQEATTNVLRHGAPGGEVRGHIGVGDDTVRLTISNSVPSGAAGGQLAHLSSGYGLRGIRERVAVSGGTFSAGTVGPRWCVAVTLPVAPVVAVARGRHASG
ncbi:hypothetical protein CFI00_19830 [Nocardioides sp. S5]|uniref:sensor histidine kinase n=1 Tax=Nocardioides sp. S5 TaxID=2017486 RepID=UPI001A8C491F|nr:histidine kinase [Nocardioides sp. S5]QSR32705.1 hypothetical protein CFI00_19830 [Nocardioides sp. S5]